MVFRVKAFGARFPSASWGGSADRIAGWRQLNADVGLPVLQDQQPDNDILSLRSDSTTTLGRVGSATCTEPAGLLTDEKRIDRFVGEIAHFADCAEGTNLPTRTLVHEDRYSSSPLERSAED